MPYRGRSHQVPALLLETLPLLRCGFDMMFMSSELLYWTRVVPIRSPSRNLNWERQLLRSGQSRSQGEPEHVPEKLQGSRGRQSRHRPEQDAERSGAQRPQRPPKTHWELPRLTLLESVPTRRRCISFFLLGYLLNCLHSLTVSPLCLIQVE